MSMFAHPFMQYAFLGGTAVALAAGLVGYFLVLRAQVFTADALSHVAFTGALAALAYDLIGACPGVRRSTDASIVQIEVDSGRLCKNDRIRVFDPVEARNIGIRAFPHCRLGMFTPIPGS